MSKLVSLSLRALSKHFPRQHTLAALRVMLPSQIKLVSGFASLNREFLKPEDTINAVVQSADGSHGVLDLTWGAPTASAADRAAKGITIVGTDGWLSVQSVKIVEGPKPVGGTRITVVKFDSDCPSVITASGEEFRFDLVLGADGIKVQREKRLHFSILIISTSSNSQLSANVWSAQNTTLPSLIRGYTDGWWISKRILSFPGFAMIVKPLG